MVLVKIFVKAPKGSDNSPHRMRSVDLYIRMYGGHFRAQPSTLLPIEGKDGTYEVHIINPGDKINIEVIRRTLTDEGLEIVGEEVL